MDGNNACPHYSGSSACLSQMGLCMSVHKTPSPSSAPAWPQGWIANSCWLQRAQKCPVKTHSPGHARSFIRFLISFGNDASALQVFHLVECDELGARGRGAALSRKIWICPTTHLQHSKELPDLSQPASQLNFSILLHPFLSENTLSLLEGPQICPS